MTVPNRSPGPVVVGVDRPTPIGAVTAYGAMEAARHHIALVLLHVVEASGAAPRIEEWIASAEVGLQASSEALRLRHPDLRISAVVVAGSAGAELVTAAEEASVVVVGARGAGGFAELLVGSVAHQVTTRAAAPVIVVRHDGAVSGVEAGADSGPILVAVDGADESSAAIDFSFQEAAARGVPLVAVNAWPVLGSGGLAQGKLWSIESSTWQREMEADSEALLAAALAGPSQRYPGVPVKQMIVPGDNICRTLLDAGDELDAALIVVGAKGVHPMARVLLGSVAQQVVHHSRRAVAVVPLRAGSVGDA